MKELRSWGQITYKRDPWEPYQLRALARGDMKRFHSVPSQRNRVTCDLKNSFLRGGQLICLVGIDGTGKTSLAKILVRKLRALGYRTIYVYGRNTPTTFKFMRAVALLGSLERLSEPHSRSIFRAKATNKGLSQNVYRKILLFEYVIKAFFQIILPKWVGYVVICDRYVQDTVINDVAVLMDFSPKETFSEFLRVSRALPRPDLVFLLDADPKVVSARKTDLISQPELEVRRRLYLYIADPETRIVDASKPLKVLVDQGMDSILKLIDGSVRSHRED